MEWLRLYSEILNDSKIMLLPETYRWRYVALLCVASEQKERGTIPDDKTVAFKLRISQDEWNNTRQELQHQGLISLNESAKYVINEWSESQGSFNYLRPNASEWQVLRAMVFERNDYTCQYCGRRGVKLECDHIHPISRGGSNRLDNLTTACKECNRSKRAKTLEEWRQS